jgi:hydroxypyruvate reductase
MARDLRADARSLIMAGLRAVDPARLVAATLSDASTLARWSFGLARDASGPPATPLDHAGHGDTLLVAIGKAAGGMVRGAHAVLGDHLTAGVAVAPDGAPVPDLPRGIRLHRASHPLPDARSVQAARDIRRLLAGAGERDRVLVLLSGGGSALVTDPEEGLDLDAVRAAHRVLIASGWPIGKVNDVRRTLDRLKGGGMARLSAPAATLGLVLSDIPGGRIDDVASGPLSPMSRSARDVEVELRRGRLWDSMPEAVQASLTVRRLERPAIPPDVTLHAIGSGGAAVEAVSRAAAELGYSVHQLGGALEGEARGLGRGLARAAIAVRDGVASVPLPACLVGAGEATVEVVGGGSGGPNQEVAIAAALALDGQEGILVGSLGTDGVDGPTDAAGGWADGQSVTRARRRGLDLRDALARNDAGTALKDLGDRIVTGPTGTNVADLYLALVDER